ncbi:hypothetical protein [Mycobacterium sp. shizuoka-1]|nr:hypothetical protein [Mycobacterium sp. shizuoka-1]
MTSRSWLSRRVRQMLHHQDSKAAEGLWRPAWQSNPAAVRPTSWWRAL